MGTEFFRHLQECLELTEAYLPRLAFHHLASRSVPPKKKQVDILKEFLLQVVLKRGIFWSKNVNLRVKQT